MALQLALMTPCSSYLFACFASLIWEAFQEQARCVHGWRSTHVIKAFQLYLHQNSLHYSSKHVSRGERPPQYQYQYPLTSSSMK